MNKKITTSVLAAAIGATLLACIAVTPASAQTTAAARLSKIIARSDTAITARLTALNNLNTRVAAMKNVSADEKTSLATAVQTNIAGLTSLKAKIDADTNVTTAAADAKTITGSFRIYALIIPQGYIAAAADRVDTITAMMTSISSKLQARITTDQAAGKNVTAMQASLADLNAKVADANTQAATAQAGVDTLVPDQGNAPLLASNTAALKASRADIKTSTTDLTAARADAQSILSGLKALE